MKLKLIVALLALAGLAAALAFASPTRAGDGTTTTTTTGGPTAAGEQHGKKAEQDSKKEKGEHGRSVCQNVELKGAAGSGTVTFTVSRSEHKSSSLVGKQVTVTIPAGSALSVQACRDATGALTLRGLHVGKASQTQTQTTTTSTTGATGATAAQP